ncbi:MAG TPA: shikimate kinase [Sediminispirochaeta sp.]|nr:shikimate kinase [Sediminispirochaeta sp.]
MTPASIVLMGLKHSGKSSLGSAVAEALSRPFFDLDDLVLDGARERGFSSIRLLYGSLGLEKFQDLEYAALEELFHRRVAESSLGFILSLGGGTGENHRVMHSLSEHGAVRLYLRVAEETLWRRISAGGIPPFLEGDRPPEELFHKLYLRRDQLYGSCADFIIEMTDRPPEENSRILLDEVRTILRG